MGGRDPREGKMAPGVRTVKGLLPALAFARPHWTGIALSVALMAFQAGANTGRFLLLYPIVTRVFLPGSVGAPEEPTAPAEEPPAPGGTDEAGRYVNEFRRRAGSLAGGLERFTDFANSLTGALIPAAWLEASVPKSATAEEARVIRAQRLDQYATLLTVLLLFVFFIVVMCAASYGESYVAEKVRLHILMDVREALCAKLLDQPVGFYDSQRRGELVQRVLGDVEGYATALNLLLDGVIQGVLNVAATLMFLFMLSWQLTLGCLLGLPFFLPMFRLMRRTLKRAHRRQQESARRVEVLLQIFSGIRTVKAFGTEGRRVREFRAADEEVTRRALKVQRSRSAADALTAFINNFLAMVLAVGGGFLLLSGLLPVGRGELMIFLVLVGNLYQPLKRVVKQFTSLQDRMASVERTTEYLALPPGSPDRPGAIAFPGLTGTIRFENVSFSYVPGQPVIRDVSFEIEKGSTVALVGPSGGGKSTLCDLLLRFYDPDQGRITIDGHDAREFKRQSLLARTAVVTQTPFLFHTTIRENLRQGKPDATAEEMADAARAAQIHEFISALPAGYEEEVGESGVRLSGGQRQRITIARALVRNPDILVLDEATSNLDTSSEKLVQEALERLQAGRTTLVVAHRLSTIRHADRIVVIDLGRIVEHGTHEELIARGGTYADLVRMQDLGVMPVAADEDR